MSNAHLYDGERCTFCGVNIHDAGLSAPDKCVDHEPVAYRTDTPAKQDREETRNG